MASPQLKSALTLALLWLGAAALPAQSLVASAIAPKTVALEAGSCASVANGDLVTLIWNPGFNSTASSSGLHDMTLIFARPETPHGKGSVPRGDFFLKALAAKPKLGIDTPIVDNHNGFSTITFRAELGTVQSGRYNLVYASAGSEADATTGVEAHAMTNSPANSFFCLEVTSSPARKK